MRKQKLKKANGQKTAELLPIVASCSFIRYSNETSQAALKLQVKFTPQEDTYVSSLEWSWIYAGVSKNTIWVLPF